ncbi:putative fad binding domain protein [Phaeoacremonium minimum UCRPA7]|uniref:Putative fad binding domain protein n=1 Tax=Phaeoacremonium minimum (strain UCR-PA7) TaxID=1286976 RepID=R8BUA2_PHAM7|nr:putative fad binding domain protein [Phaeoacremonium minimum UCRPA7]EOO02957.1 putative fad binding domain protein [Phaeoacremonium minimum UCRPA7]
MYNPTGSPERLLSYGWPMTPDICSNMGDEANKGIHLVVIGAGLAGLAAAVSTKLANPAHQVTVLEATKELQELGAGLQVTPNGARLLQTWGLSVNPACPETLSVHRFDGTKLLAHEPALQKVTQERYGAPFWDVHRVDLQRAMVSRLEELGGTIRLNSRASSVDFEAANVSLADGSQIAGDVVLLADGLWSTIRGQFLGRDSPAILTGDLAYRITLPVDSLRGWHAPELAAWISDRPRVDFWVGAGSHAVGYPMRGGSVYNLVFLCPDDLPPDTNKQAGDLDELRQRFATWDPILRKLIGQVQAVHKWRLMWLDALPQWARDDGTFFMAGDCCHPMLPYLAQGANSSLEDGAVLGHLLGKVSLAKKKEKLPRVAEMYQRLRMGRGRQIQLETFKQRDDFHLPDGEAQERRDKLMLGQLGKEVQPGFPSRWTSPDIQAFLYAYDAYAEAEKAYQESPF